MQAATLNMGKFPQLIATITLFLCCNSALAVSNSVHHAITEGQYATYPKVDYGTGEKAKSIKRGEYLTYASDCIACHTKPGGAVFSGGLPFKTPFGTIYSMNITPDKETGIGNWSVDDFERAMRHGVSPQGKYYFPVFPYVDFSKMSKQDIVDLKNYFDAIPAVKQKNLEPDMPFPFNWRFMQLGWRILFFHPYKGEFKPDPEKSDAWNRGAYLVQGPGHCGMCHTPLNFLGAPKRQYYLTGGFVDGFYAPNISATTMEGHTIKEIEDVFLHDKRLEGGKLAAHPMLEVNHDSLDYMTREDLDAIATYIRTVKSKVPASHDRDEKVSKGTGKKIYDKYCVACHVSGAGGAPIVGDKKAWEPHLTKGLNILYKNSIAGIGNMPPKGACATCSNAQVQAAVDYMAALSGGETLASIDAGEAAEIPELPKPSLELGEQVYDKVCFSCHNEGVIGAPKIGDQAAWKDRIAQNMDVLYKHTLQGYKGHPLRGACYQCSDTDVIAAVKYMVEKSKSEGTYTLW